MYNRYYIYYLFLYLPFCIQFCYLLPVTVLVTMLKLCSDELKKDKFGVEIRVENATVVSDGDVEACVSIRSHKVKYVMVFVLENHGDATVKLLHCDMLKTYGFTRGHVENKGIIEPG